MATWSATVGVFFLPLACEPHHTHSLLSDSQRERVCVWCSRRYWLLAAAGRRTTWLSPVSSQPRPTTVRWPCCWNVNPASHVVAGRLGCSSSSRELTRSEPCGTRKKEKRKIEEKQMIPPPPPSPPPLESLSHAGWLHLLIGETTIFADSPPTEAPCHTSIPYYYYYKNFFSHWHARWTQGGNFLLFVREANTFCSFIFSIPTQWTFDLRGMSMTFTTNIW